MHLNFILKLGAALLGVLGTAVSASASDSSLRNSIRITDWEFSKDSTSWQHVTVPHDWAIYGPFDRKYDLQKVAVEQNGETEETWKTGRTGGLPYVGKGWYKTVINIPDTAGKSLTLKFDGAMSHAKVKVNGKQVAYWPYGYNTFTANLDGVAVPGDNVVEVSLENKTAVVELAKEVEDSVLLAAVTEAGYEPKAIL